MTTGRATLLAHVSEEAWLQQVIAWAKRSGWWWLHVRASRGTPHGWPDLVLIRPPEIVFAETKSATGRLTPRQRFVHDLLRRCGHPVHVWKPTDEAEVKRVLGLEP